MPALLTSTAGAPTSASTRSSAARSVTSACTTSSPSWTSSPTTRAPAPASAAVHTGPRFPSAPVTTARRPARPSALIGRAHGRALRRPRDQLLEVVEREGRVLGDRVAQRAADHRVELVRGKAAVRRRLQSEILSGERVTRRERAGGDELLAHLRDRVRLARMRDLVALAEREARALEVTDELAQADRLEREAVVGALHRSVEREVLLDDAAAEHVRRDRHRDPVVVAGVADDRALEQLPVGLDHTQVELVPVLDRIAGGALEQPEMRVDLGDAV